MIANWIKERARRSRLARRDREAQDWVVRLDAGALSKPDTAALARWLLDASNEAALRKATRIWTSIDDALLIERIDAIRFSPSAKVTPASRKVMLVACVGLSLLVAGSVTPSLLIALRADARTGAGEAETVTLADGSHLTLDSNSAIAAEYTPAERRVRLLAGRVRFAVSPNRIRPFIVEAEGGETRALGTVFSVDRYRGDVRVDAIEHDIRVTKRGRSVILHPGYSVHYATDLKNLAASGPEPDSWTHGTVRFENAALADVAGELQRYSTKRIVVVGSARGRRFSGVVRTADPIGGILTAAAAGSLSVRSFPGIVLIAAR